MSSDPVVAEIRRIREELAARFNYDLDAIIEDARRRYLNGEHKVIRLPPRPPSIAVAKPRQPLSEPANQS